MSIPSAAEEGTEYADANFNLSTMSRLVSKFCKSILSKLNKIYVCLFQLIKCNGMKNINMRFIPVNVVIENM